MTARLLITVSALLVIVGPIPSSAIPGLSRARQAVSVAADAATDDAEETKAPEPEPAPSATTPSAPSDTHAILPFPVLIDGEPAKVVTPNASYAVIKDAVTPYVEVTAKAEADMMIINIFPCDSDGNVASDVSPAIIIGQGTTTVTLDNTLDKQPLDPGNYIMNIVIAELGTARVKFLVE
jgi:hypothetical protein